jgi:hypothetical protein
MHIFAEFRATKATREEAAKVAQEIVEGQARQATIHQYFQLTPTQRAKQVAEDRIERQQGVQEILQQANFNFPKLHLLSHYGSQISNFGTLPQYSTEITEALHKPLKDAYRRSNRVDAVEQILDTISRDYAIQMKELNLIAWSGEVKLPPDVREVLGIVNKKGLKSRSGRPTLRGKQSVESSSLSSLATLLGIPSLIDHFCDYLRLNLAHIKPPPTFEEVSHYKAHYYSTLSVCVPQFQGNGELVHQIRWTGKRAFRQRGEARADWVWVRRWERRPVEQRMGQLDGRIVGRLEGLFSVQEEEDKNHEVALVMLLQLRGPTKPWGEEGMIRVERREEGKDMYMVRTKDIEGIAHLVAMDADGVWLVNNRIDFTTWNELYA